MKSQFGRRSSDPRLVNLRPRVSTLVEVCPLRALREGTIQLAKLGRRKTLVKRLLPVRTVRTVKLLLASQPA